jgi:hypothetical protein
MFSVVTYGKSVQFLEWLPLTFGLVGDGRVCGIK